MFQQDPDEALAALTSSSGFLETESEYKTAFDSRIRHSKALVTKAVQPLLPLAGAAIVARGSFARGDFSSYSDIDLILISLTASHRPTLDLKLISHTVARRVSLAEFDVFDLDRVLTLPHLASALTHLRFICGDTSVIRVFIENARSALTVMPAARLTALRTHDIGRTWKDSDPSSPHYYSLKQGQGGFVDYEFIKLVGEWLRLRRCLDSTFYKALWHSELAYRYWAILKEFLQLWSGGPLESCQPLYSALAVSEVPELFRSSAIDSVREAHKNAMSVILAEIRKEKNGDGVAI
jgi:predicted nucleotidyltransferase